MNRIFALLVFSFSVSAQSEVLHWPQLCSAGELILSNKSHEQASVWLQVFDQQLEAEEHQLISAGETAEIALAELPQGQRYSLLHFNQAQKFEAYYRCHGVQYRLSSLQGGELTFRKSSADSPTLWVQNIFDGPNHLQVEILNSQFKAVGRLALELKNNEYKKISSDSFGVENTQWSYFRIRSTEKYISFHLTQNGHSSPIMIEPVKTQVSTEPAYFLVGARDSETDNFIAPIRDPRLIAEARALIAHPQREKILFATVQKNHNGVNRNWSKVEKSFWSWSVHEVTSFGDLGSTSCNGTPQFVEDRASQWVEYVGRICFWSYRVKKELTPTEVASGKNR